MTKLFRARDASTADLAAALVKLRTDTRVWHKVEGEPPGVEYVEERGSYRNAGISARSAVVI